MNYHLHVRWASVEHNRHLLTLWAHLNVPEILCVVIVSESKCKILTPMVQRLLCWGVSCHLPVITSINQPSARRNHGIRGQPCFCGRSCRFTGYSGGVHLRSSLYDSTQSFERHCGFTLWWVSISAREYSLSGIPQKQYSTTTSLLLWIIISNSCYKHSFKKSLKKNLYSYVRIKPHSRTNTNQRNVSLRSCLTYVDSTRCLMVLLKVLN